ncbi:hypothetical protein FRB96_009228 [Tulasnella sp. 330]|nr:hypothetical protein FRB96_009228 [Tulasnella sp. 330]KAG8873519.1 hypothetical protein FRB97_006662 [Tulasnella sp. 331]KAG8881390.1 hypothetical protein FRB98_004370 [Tulasnella sp. 332]
MATLSKPNTSRWLTTSPVFVALSILGGYVLHAHLSGSEGSLALEMNGVKYSSTGIGPIDTIMDILVTFFTHSVTPGSMIRTFGYEFWANLAIFVAILETEAVRTGASAWLKWTAIWGVLYQIAGGGMIVPIYNMVFLSLYPSPTSRGSAITAAGSNGVLFGLLFGYAPSIIGMYALATPREFALFQFMPIYVGVLRYIYISITGSSNGKPLTKNQTTEGYHATLRNFILLSIVSSFIHIRYVLLPIISHPTPMAYFEAFYVPSISIPSPAVTTAATAVHHFLQWDYILILGPTFLAGIWDFDIIKKVQLTAWFIQASVVLGPGAALAGVWAYREKVMQEYRMKMKE